MNRVLTNVVAAFALAVGPFVYAAEKKLNLESILYRDFKTVERFGMISVSLEGSAEKIGLKKDDLTDYLRLRFKNSFAGIKFKEPADLVKILQDEKKTTKIGTIFVHVWTVGDNYPVAYHVEIRAGNLNNSRVYEDAYLGYGSKRNVPDSVRRSISKLADALAVAFLKARGEL